MVNTEIRLIIFFAAKDGEALHSQQKQDQELTVAQIMNSLLWNSDRNWGNIGKTNRPFRYDLNQIPYDYTVEVRNRFKDLDLIDKSAWWTMEWGSWHCTGDSSTHGHHQMVNTEIRLIIFFVAKDGEDLHSQQKQDQELTVA